MSAASFFRTPSAPAFSWFPTVVPPLDAGFAGRADRCSARHAATSLSHSCAGRYHQGLCGHGKRRLAVAPEIPTTDEAGLPGFYFSFWHALWAPKDTPKAVIAKLNDGVVSTLADQRCVKSSSIWRRRFFRARSRRRRRLARITSRDREMVADYQGGGNQAAMSIHAADPRRRQAAIESVSRRGADTRRPNDDAAIFRRFDQDAKGVAKDIIEGLVICCSAARPIWCASSPPIRLNLGRWFLGLVAAVRQPNAGAISDVRLRISRPSRLRWRMSANTCATHTSIYGEALGPHASPIGSPAGRCLSVPAGVRRAREGRDRLVGSRDPQHRQARHGGLGKPCAAYLAMPRSSKSRWRRPCST